MAFSRVIQPWSQGGMKNMGKDLAQNCPQQIPCCPPLLQPRPLCTLFQPLWNECLTAAVSLALPGPCGSPSRVAGTALGSQPRVARWGLSRQRCFPCAASVVVKVASISLVKQVAHCSHSFSCFSHFSFSLPTKRPEM